MPVSYFSKENSLENKGQFDRAKIFDGLIIYPPLELKEQCVNAAIRGTDFPDFSIETIELIDMDFAREHFPDGELTFD